MAKKKVVKKRVSPPKLKTGRQWAGFNPFQLIVIFAVFIVFAVIYLM